MLPPAPSAPAASTSAASLWPAIAQVLVGVSFFSCSDATAKFLRETLPAGEVAWLRYIVFAAMGIGLAYRRGLVGALSRRPRMQGLRALAVLGSSVFFIGGLSFLPMADAAALSFVSPAFITALSVVFLSERVGVHRWGATIAGLIGVLIVIRPGSGTLQWAALYPLASAACWAVGMIATRVIGAQDRGEVTLLWSSVLGLLLLTAALPFGFVPFGWREGALGLLMGVTSSTGQFLMILAYRRASASILAPFSYIQLITSATLGYILFGNLPDAVAFLGGAVIILSGLYIVYRERRARRLRTV